MTKKDAISKIMFAVELALLPLVIFAYLYINKWTIGLFIAGILVCKLWVAIFDEKTEYKRDWLTSIGDVLIFSTILIMFAVNNILHIALCVVAIAFIVIYNILKLLMYKKSMPETIVAVEQCVQIFEYITLISFTFVLFYNLVAKISLIALVLSTAISIVYRIIYAIKFNIFKK